MDKRRSYVQRARAESAQATRTRILDAAQGSFDHGPLAAVRIEDVAKRAGVSRSTVYQLFDSRTGVLEALAERLRVEGGFDRLVEAASLPDAREAFRRALREQCRMFAQFPDLARALFTLAAIDADGAAAVAALERGRRPGMRDLAARLAAQGQLRDDVTVDQAAQLLTVATGHPAFDELHAGFGLPADEVADRLIAMGERAICRDA
jgi:AcrR family transcriptional regulator